MKFIKSINILGTRGIPAAHGGFETFAQQLALFLVSRGWQVAVYCQDEVEAVGQRLVTEEWRGIELRRIRVAADGPRATLEFDWHCVRDAARRPGVCLVLGYNSAIFLPYLRLYGRKILTNMDGIEWRRPKWGLMARSWLWVNEWIAAWVSHRLVADHPVIADHLATRRGRDAISTIPYGGVPVEEASEAPVRALGLEPDRYLISIARLEPDNNILTLVTAFSRQRRHAKLVIVGTIDEAFPYHRRLVEAASEEVLFSGAIYDAEVVCALRFHARGYLHGHTVGGTNPSLVEAMWAGNAVIAHDNAFNRWTAGDAGSFFKSDDECAALIDQFLHNHDIVLQLRRAARRQAQSRFKWHDILSSYEREAERMIRDDKKVVHAGATVDGSDVVETIGPNVL